MREGWSDKEAARVLDVHPAKVSQALTPALLKIARLWQADPTATMTMLLAVVRELHAQEDLDARQSAACRLATYKMQS